MDLCLVHFGISKRFLDWLHGATEQVCVQLFESGTGDRRIEIDALKQRIYFNAGLGGRRERTLRPLTGSAQSSHSTLVACQVLLVLALEFLDEVVDHSVVEVLAAKMCVSSCGLDFKYSIFNGQDGDIKCTTTKIKNKDISFSMTLLIQTICNGCSRGFVNDSKNIQASDGTRILCGLPLGIIEVGRNCDNSARYSLAQVGLCRFFHLR